MDRSGSEEPSFSDRQVANKDRGNRADDSGTNSYCPWHPYVCVFAGNLSWAQKRSSRIPPERACPSSGSENRVPMMIEWIGKHRSKECEHFHFIIQSFMTATLEPPRTISEDRKASAGQPCGSVGKDLHRTSVAHDHPAGRMGANSRVLSLTL